jgi:hypothetical protein
MQYSKGGVECESQILGSLMSSLLKSYLDLLSVTHLLGSSFVYLSNFKCHASLQFSRYILMMGATLTVGCQVRPEVSLIHTSVILYSNGEVYISFICIIIILTTF